jgi:hypothetical protein
MIGGGSDNSGTKPSSAPATKETSQQQPSARVLPAPTTMPGAGEARRDAQDPARPRPAATTMPGDGDSVK